MSIAIVIAACVVGALLLALPRVLIGPTLHDRAIAAKTLLVRTVLIVAASATAAGRSDLLDVALALAFMALVLCVAIAKVFRARSFQPALVQAGER